MSTFPEYRPRRLRRTETLRRLVRETTVSVDDLILPLFAAPGTKFRKPISSMPGVAQTSVDELVLGGDEPFAGAKAVASSKEMLQQHSFSEPQSSCCPTLPPQPVVS